MTVEFCRAIDNWHMNKRNTTDAEIQRIVSWINYPTQEVDLIKETKTWNEEDFFYAIERLQTNQPSERREQLRPLYWTRLKECQAADARMALEQANVQRHDEISKRLDELNEISRQLKELKKPHWSIVPNFWLTAAILILTAIGIIVALRH
jgi:hypothetical protein